jgi:hypothetical protein
LYRQEGQVKLLRISLASLVACAVIAAPAHAETGNGLYEPFPSPSSNSLAQRFVDSLPGGLGFTSPRGLDLGRGVLVGRAAQAAYTRGGQVTERSASGSGFTGTLGWPLALVLLAAALGGAWALAARRRA